MTSVLLKIQSLEKIAKCLIIWSNHFKTLVAMLLPNGIHFIFISYGLLEVLGQAQLQAQIKYALKQEKARKSNLCTIKSSFSWAIFRSPKLSNKLPMDFHFKPNKTNLVL